MTGDEWRAKGFEGLDPARLGGLSASQRDAIARTVVARGPALMRAGATRRLVGAALAGCAVAAGLALALLPGTPRDDTKSASLPAVATPVCMAEVPERVSDARGLRAFRVGDGLRGVVSDAALVTFVETTTCAVRLELARGALNLDGLRERRRTVSVQAPGARFEARAALFRVVVAASHTTVDVASGQVVVMRDLAPAETLDAGVTLTFDGRAATRSVLSDEAQKALQRAFMDAEAAPLPGPVDTLPVAADAAPRAKQAVRAASRARREPAPKAATVPEAGALLARAEALWRSGERDAARAAFRSAGEAKGASGEAAWVRLARLELAARSPAGALAALRARAARGPDGVLGAEASWLEVQALTALGRHDDARRVAEQLVRSQPSSAQAAVARRWLAGEGAR